MVLPLAKQTKLFTPVSNVKVWVNFRRLSILYTEGDPFCRVYELLIQSMLSNFYVKTNSANKK